MVGPVVRPKRDLVAHLSGPVCRRVLRQSAPWAGESKLVSLDTAQRPHPRKEIYF